jgi:hypothetical protein
LCNFIIRSDTNGVNIGVPVPREPFSFDGWNESKFGTGDITGKSLVEFWTMEKKSTVKWDPRSRRAPDILPSGKWAL